MLKKRLIPSLLLQNGRCVKGIHFDNMRDVGNPVTAARVYDAQGADELFFLDISASHENRSALLHIIRETAEQCFMPLTVGGGVRSVDEIRDLLLAGADKVSINTAALQRPEFIREAARKFGSQCVVVAMDVRKENGDYRIYTHGGRNATDWHPLEWAKAAVAHGAGELLVVSIDRDGTREGYDLELLRMIADAVSVPVVAAGGCGTLEHFVQAIREGHASAVSAASIFHFTDQSPIKARYYMQVAGLDVRPIL